MRSRQRYVAILFTCALAVFVGGWAPARLLSHTGHLSGPFRTLIVGGGPNLKYNQVAIESNVRYVSRLLPTGATKRVLFTDGDPESKNVKYEGEDTKTYYRAPLISKIDGPSELTHIQAELSTISGDASANPRAPIFLYFTGHGSGNPGSEYNNNSYDLWNDKSLTVKDLSGSLRSFPKETPITLVMVECFSGAFGNLLFQDANPMGQQSDLNLCGFFASVPNREAAGCTPAVNEANYRDFTSFFFAALSGIDRLGKTTSGADYNHDGKIGMNEAFAYSLIHDDSIDTPVCTSDFFLRRFVVAPEAEVMSTPFHLVKSWAAPAQLAVLNALSASLEFTDDDGVQKAYAKFRAGNAASLDLDFVRLYRFVRMAKSVVLAHRLQLSSDEPLKVRYAALLKLESANPLR